MVYKRLPESLVCQSSRNSTIIQSVYNHGKNVCQKLEDVTTFLIAECLNKNN